MLERAQRGDGRVPRDLVPEGHCVEHLEGAVQVATARVHGDEGVGHGGERGLGGGKVAELGGGGVDLAPRCGVAERRGRGGGGGEGEVVGDDAGGGHGGEGGEGSVGYAGAGVVAEGLEP